MPGESYGRYRIGKERLANGLRILTASRPGAQSTALRIITKTGSAFEQPSQQGIAHFLEHMLFQGTDRYPSFSAIGQTVEALGGIINGGTDRMTTTYWIKVLPENREHAFDLLADLVLHSRFAPADIERERSIISEEIHRRRDRPDEYVEVLLMRDMWPDQPLGRETLGTVETISALTRDDLLSYLGSQYVASDLVVSAAGAVDHDQFVSLVRRYFDSMPAGQPKALPSGTFGSGPAVSYDRRQTAQIQLALGFPAIGYDDPRIYAAQLLTTALGRGIGSRLFLAVRQRLGLAYSIGADLRDLVTTGDFQIRGGIKPSGLKEALGAILRELRAVIDELPGEAEVNRTKEMQKSRLLFSTESDDAIADRLGRQELLLGRTIPIEEEIEAYDGASPDDLRQAARLIFDLGSLKIAAIGEVSREQLEAALAS